MKYALILAIVLCAAGCGERRAANAAAHHLASIGAPTIKNLDAERDAAIQDRDADNIKIASLNKQIDAAEQRAFVARCRWTAYACMVLAGLALGASLWLPAMQRMCMLISGSLAGVAVLALFVARFIVWIEWSALAIAIIGAAFFLLRLAPRLHLLHAMLPHVGDVWSKLTAKEQALAGKLKDKLTKIKG